MFKWIFTLFVIGLILRLFIAAILFGLAPINDAAATISRLTAW